MTALTFDCISMADDDEEREEVLTLQREYEWVLRDDVNKVLKEVETLLADACRKFAVYPCTGNADNLVRPEKFVFSGFNGPQQIKCMVTLLADNICEADVSLKHPKQHTSPICTKIYPDIPWKVQQIQDAGNYLLQALRLLHMKDAGHVYRSGHEVVRLLDRVLNCLNQGRSSLAVPKRRSLEELIKNPSLNAFQPPLPKDTVVSFYIQAQKLVVAVYHLNLNSPHKTEVTAKHQMEVSVPWLNDILVLFSVTLHLCQQLHDKMTLFLQYTKDVKIQVPDVSCLNSGATQEMKEECDTESSDSDVFFT
ncbi:Protein rogdi [Lamellibrachia satsuma]|nr:Protein rogdi [Lamellibrachia satsuma]